MSQRCGDDLIAARRFTDLCQAYMSEMFSGEALDFTDVVSKLAEIQSGAKLMHARSIYKSAQTVIEDLTKRQSADSCANSVLVLQKLIRQYEAGLSEIAPVVQKPAALPETPKGPAVVSEMAQMQTAADNLRPLLKFADETEKPGLVRLLSLAANDRAPRPGRREKFEMIMPGLTNHWLRLARANDKSISVSVSSAETALESTVLRQLETKLKTIGETLILSCIDLPDERAQQGLSRSAHLAVTAKTNGQYMDVLLSCDACLPSGFSFEPSGDNLPVTISEDNGTIRVEIYRLPAAETATEIREAVL